MSTATIMVGMESIGVIFLLIILYGIEFENRHHNRKSRTFATCVALMIVALISDIFAWQYENVPRFDELITVLNFLSITMGELVVSAFAYYEITVIREKRSISNWHARGILIINIICIAFMVYETVQGNTFTVVDGVITQGIYYRTGYILIAISMLYLMILSLTAAKSLGTHDTIALISYDMIPLLAVIIENTGMKIELSYLACVVATVVLYIMMQSGAVAELHAMEKVLTRYTYTDTLTGLGNYRAYSDALSGIDKDAFAAIVYCDVNRLKYTNDHIGHKAGDMLLLDFSAILRRIFSSSNCYRVGGDEFVVIISGMETQVFDGKLAQLMAEVESRDEIASIGSSRGNGMSVLNLVAEAEERMYNSKLKFRETHPMIAAAEAHSKNDAPAEAYSSALEAASEIYSDIPKEDGLQLSINMTEKPDEVRPAIESPEKHDDGNHPGPSGNAEVNEHPGQPENTENPQQGSEASQSSEANQALKENQVSGANPAEKPVEEKLSAVRRFLESRTGFVVLLALAAFSMAAGHLYSLNEHFYILFNILWPMLFLYAERHSSTHKQSMLGLLFLMIGFIFRFWGFFGNDWVNALIMIISGGFIFVAFQADRTAMRKGIIKPLNGRIPGIGATLVFPTVWMALYALCYFIKLGTQFRIGFFMFGSKPFIQLASIFGDYGLTFIMLWFSSLIIYAIDHRKEKAGKKAFILQVSLLALMMIFGGVRLAASKTPDKYASVAYSTGPYIGDFLTTDMASYEENVESLEKSIRTASEGGADVIVFNEEAFSIYESKEHPFIDFASELARKYNINVLLPLDLEPDGSTVDDKSSNCMVWIDCNGRIGVKYYKFGLVPLIETSEYRRGMGHIPSFRAEIGAHDINTSCAICYDGNFSNYISTMSRDTELLLLPSWDWRAITEQHYRIIGLVAVENGVTVIKPTYDGITIAADPYGRILSMTDTRETGFETVQFLNIPIAGTSTVYGLIGPYLHWSCLIITLIFAVVLAIRKFEDGGKTA